MDTALNRCYERRHRRRHRVEDHGIVATLVRPGHCARLINVSAGGALIDTNYRLLPGSSVELHMEAKEGRTTVRGRVTRCAVVRVRANSVCYRGAIAFDRYLPWLQDDDGYRVPTAERRSGQPPRADATQELI
ncbi:MAG TPA: PilZ domain-containing protein [Vicinamibacterales bacterium]|nr:PilZ domain-containing protein [Vicinamibacterales bacterium]